MAASNLKVKLLVDKKNQKVLFAEAEKEVVDFLFNLLALPVGTVVKLILTKDSMVGSLGNLYKSVENLSEAYLESNQSKLSLLEPKLSASVSQMPLLLSNPTAPTTPDKGGTVYFYRCPYSCNNYNYVTSDRGTSCPSCRNQMSTKMTYVAGAGTAEEQIRGDGGGAGRGGYVKGLVTYMIMDDLSVTPLSTISGITVMSNFNVIEVGSLEEKVFDLDMDLGLAILKASLQSKTVLTDVFLGKKLKQGSGKKEIDISAK
ncbi:uncharacterized protein LOC122649730 [Telopea speciosissima]|uniref:uncharacterized protein LOC122649730 n=1 Tax=Telopea speciosissima TaxID=54955 RepID=UPI001CC452C5|nr:uncharacterized protein LOC122649730 [Telopea speciosissima]